MRSRKAFHSNWRALRLSRWLVAGTMVVLSCSKDPREITDKVIHELAKEGEVADSIEVTQKHIDGAKIGVLIELGGGNGEYHIDNETTIILKGIHKSGPGSATTMRPSI